MLEPNVFKMRPRIADQADVSNADASFPDAADNGSQDVDATLHADKCHHDCRLIALKFCLQDAVMSLASSRYCQPVYRDLSVIHRDVVASGFAGKRRAQMISSAFNKYFSNIEYLFLYFMIPPKG